MTPTLALTEILTLAAIVACFVGFGLLYRHRGGCRAAASCPPEVGEEGCEACSPPQNDPESHHARP